AGNPTVNGAGKPVLSRSQRAASAWPSTPKAAPTRQPTPSTTVLSSSSAPQLRCVVALDLQGGQPRPALPDGGAQRRGDRERGRDQEHRRDLAEGLKALARIRGVLIAPL